MANKIVKYLIDVVGNAVEKLKQISDGAKRATGSVNGLNSAFSSISKDIITLNQAFGALEKVYSFSKQFVDANLAQVAAETRLEQVMRNTMDATDGQIESIKKLTAAQQKIGIVGDEIQLAGAQELATYIGKTKSLEDLIPVMNGMIAQQRQFNATQEDAVTIGSMIGKVMNGQAEALSRYGYKFTEAQAKVIKFGSEEQRVAMLAEVIGPVVNKVNEALANTPEGKMNNLRMQLGDMKEHVGALWVTMELKLLPVFKKLVAVGEKLMGLFETGWPAVVVLTGLVVFSVTKLWLKIMSLVPAEVAAAGGFKVFASVAQAACSKISLAITSIPIVGWIAGAVTLIVSLFALLWKKSERFRGAIYGIWEVVKPIFAWVKSLFVSVFDYFSKRIEMTKSMIMTILDVVKAVAGKVFGFMGKVFNPIIELWNKLTGSTVSKFKAGYQKGVASMGAKDGSSGIGVPVGGLAGGGSVPAGVAAGASSAVTGGTRNTSITMNISKMIDNVIFNGGLEEGAKALEEKIQEVVMRGLAAAQSAM